MLELVIVVGIISVILSIGTSLYSSSQRRARDTRRQQDLEEVRIALEQYRSNNSYYPLSINSLTSPTVYIQSIPKDPHDPRRLYYYQPLPSGCNNSSTLCNDYTYATQLENTSSCTVVLGANSCGTGYLCNYCLGPYGQK